MKKIVVVLFAVVFLLAGSGCNKSQNGSAKEAQVKETKSYPNKNYVHYVDPDDIFRDKKNIGKDYEDYYSKYIDYAAPNGKAIRLVAADAVSDEQLLKAYNVLSFYLTDYGEYDKTKIANSMADKGAVLVLPGGADGDGNTPDKAIMGGQPLYQKELPTAGSKWYQENDYQHRDASYEEIFHMVHDYGIGTTANPAAQPELAQKIKEGMEKALPKNKKDWGKKGLWGLESRDWLLSLEKESSLEQEYIVSGLDSYYGLWEAYTESDKGMWGMYVPKTRQAVKDMDPDAYEIITGFLPPAFTYMERIDSGFTGTFKMYLDKEEPYTYKSQYLQNARLTGEKSSGIVGNDLDNILIGNKGNNPIDGGAGEDVVQFSGSSEEYDFEKDGEVLQVTDKNKRDGKDSLKNIEIIRFTDKDILVKDLLL